MSLKLYKKKRDFAVTNEPAGKLLSGKRPKLRFVVQKHAARRLHYDFRLELDGTLKSWAVPKGPSLNPADKRLAVQVEDHPIEYRLFEGIIPKGNYGGGTVLVWDEGTFKDPVAKSNAESERLLMNGLRKGHLSFILQGKKLNGEFSLVKMHGQGGKNWLLIKKADKFESTLAVAHAELSVLSGRTLTEIAKKSPAKGDVWDAKAKHKSTMKEKPKPSRSRSRLKIREVEARDPDLIKPMLATLVDAPFDRKNWIFEIKWDGYRAIADVSKKGAMLYSRNQKSFNQKYRPILEELARIKTPVVLDGEIVVLDSEGKSSFQRLQQYNQTGEGALFYFVFDILRLKGKDVTGLPLIERQELLKKALPPLKSIRLSEHIREWGTEFFTALAEKGLEGMIAKNSQSLYREGKRSADWLKIKTHLRQEAIICGYTRPQGSRKKFGALLLGLYEDEKLKYIGHTGTGFSHSLLAELHRQFQPLITNKCPFAIKPRTNQSATWLSPKLICEVSFQEWTGDGVMRQPSFLGLRTDKQSRAVHKELPQKATPKLLSKTAKTEDTEAPELKLTHLDKLFWPNEKLSKGDLIDYYRKIAPVILPYLKDRPQSLHRFPNGIQGPGFYQKNVDSEIASWVETFTQPSDTGKNIRYILCQNERTLLYLANLGCIEMNPWNSRIENGDNPDYLVIDLDPEAISFSKVIETALAVRKLFEEIEVESHCKTSGATGLHIYVPVAAGYEVEVVRQFAELVANIVHERIPEFTSVVRSPKGRQKKVYLDYLQNRKHQTLASVYSVRPHPGATVSTPLNWNEVKKGLDPANFTMKNIFKRLDKFGDLFAPVLTNAIDLNKALQKIKLKKQ